jgi:putative ATP-binding cassette transporter
LRDNAEAIALYGGERREHTSLRQRLYAAMRIFHRMLVWQRNVAFFTYAYDLLLPLVPLLVLAPSFFAGTLEFGKITQASAAFITLRTSLSLIIDQFSTLSGFAAVVERLCEYQEISTTGRISAAPPGISVATADLRSRSSARLASTSPHHGRDHGGTSLRSRTLRCRRGRQRSQRARGVSDPWLGVGSATPTPLSDMMFLPQRPYMVPGSLRDQLCYPREGDASDEQLTRLLGLVGLEKLPERMGGLEAQVKWEDQLTLGEQQQIAFARLLFNRPGHAFLDEATSALDPDRERALYQCLASAGISVVSVGDRLRLSRYHHALIELLGHGDWRYVSLRGADPRPASLAPSGPAPGRELWRRRLIGGGWSPSYRRAPGHVEHLRLG